MNQVNQVGVGSSPLIVEHQKNKQMDSQEIPKVLEGLTTFEAISQVSKIPKEDLKIENIEGSFEKSGNDDVLVGISKVGEDCFFKFEVLFKVDLKKPDGSLEKVEFKQTVFTTVKVPMGSDPQLFEAAKNKAYQAAKSYELLQHNLKDSIANIKTNSKDEKEIQRVKLFQNEISKLKSESMIYFTFKDQGDSPLISRDFSILKAETIRSNIPLDQIMQKVSDVGEKFFSSKRKEGIHKIEVKADELSETIPCYKYDKMEKGQMAVPQSDPEKESFKKYLKGKSAVHEEKIGFLGRDVNTIADTFKDLTTQEQFNELQTNYQKALNETNTNHSDKDVTKQFNEAKKNIDAFFQMDRLREIKDKLGVEKSHLDNLINCYTKVGESEASNKLTALKKQIEDQLEKISNYEKDYQSLLNSKNNLDNKRKNEDLEMEVELEEISNESQKTSKVTDMEVELEEISNQSREESVSDLSSNEPNIKN